MIQEVFRAEGLPLDLAYVPLIESAFKPNAVSRAKAKGMWQFMRGTALENGLKHDWYIDERADPEKATRAAANYLKTLYEMFGDWHLALASYNGGPGRVQRAMKRSGQDDFWKLTTTKRYLPRETRDYVPLILAAVIVARNPTQYGMNDLAVEPPLFERVTLPTAVDLRRVAEWAGIPVQTLQELNPELRRWTTPLRATDYELKVPEGTAEIVRASWRKRIPTISHRSIATRSRRARRCSAISRKLKVSRADLAEANYLTTEREVEDGPAADHPARADAAARGGQQIRRLQRPKRPRPHADVVVAHPTGQQHRPSKSRCVPPRRSFIASSAATRCSRLPDATTRPSKN